VLIGTAGHIDHGKTTLIRALTGVDTDRLPEEKRRGISIELGFAYLPLAPQARAPEVRPSLAFIDVPGHERFVPTMLAGAAGIDFALLVVAADDGPMPQTIEHLAILDLLGVRRGAIALSKIDRATPEQRANAERALRAALAGSPLADAPIFPVSAPSGEGIAALREHLLAVAATDLPPTRQPAFRLAVDRCFSLPGAGAVVTGTILGGQVAVGDVLHIAKKSADCRRQVRVRSLHANNRSAEVAERGTRCALNLVGISHHDADRGDWLVSPALGGPLAPPSTRLDVRLRMLPDAAPRLQPGVDLHLHHGARHVMARLVPLDPAAGFCQLVCREPLLACRGDRLILRDASAQRTLAGAFVLDPQAPARHRRRPERLQQLAALAEDDAAARLAALIAASPGGVDLARLALSNNVEIAAPAGAVIVDANSPIAFTPGRYAALFATIEEKLAAYHAQHPDELGLERERLRRISAPQLDARVFAALLALRKAEGGIEQNGSAWRLPTHRVELSAAERQRAERILPLLLASPYDPPWTRDLAAHEGIEEMAMRQLLRKLAAQGEVFQVVRDLFYHRQAIARLVGIVRELALADSTAGPLDGAAIGSGGSAAPVKGAALRDRIGLGRKRAIQILEFFDRVGFTRRVGSGQQQAHTLRGEAPVEAAA
jgi:selenocysteine-specific elongation factor